MDTQKPEVAAKTDQTDTSIRSGSLRVPDNACCAPSEQTSCCAPTEKAACCGPSHPKGCGCR